LGEGAIDSLEFVILVFAHGVQPISRFMIDMLIIVRG
jgi:hypothetical protein